ncbi:MAG: MFS transporter [Terriglobales bacterium]
MTDTDTRAGVGDDSDRSVRGAVAEAGNSDDRPGRGMFAAFEVVAFRWVWAGALSGNSGRFAVILVAGWEAYRLGHHSSVWPSLVSMFLLVPTMFFGLFAGSVADRHNRALMATTGQLLNAAACAVGALLSVTGELDLLNLLAVTALVGIGNSVQGPAWQAMIPAIVGPGRLLNASMTARIAQQGAELTGPAVGTVVLTTAGPGATFLLCALFYIAGMLMFWHLRGSVSTPSRPDDLTGALASIAAGLSYLRKQPPLGTLLVWVGLHCSLTMASIGILPQLASANLGGNAGAYGLLLAAFGFGSVLGPLLMMWLSARVSVVTTLVLSGILSGLPLISLGLVHQIDVAVVSSALAGAAQAVFMAAIYSANQGASIDAMRGRVASVQLSLTTGAMGLASIGWGALVAPLTAGVVLAVPGAVFVAACIPFTLRRHRITGVLSESTRAAPGLRSPTAGATATDLSRS